MVVVIAHRGSQQPTQLPRSCSPVPWLVYNMVIAASLVLDPDARADMHYRRNQRTPPPCVSASELKVEEELRLLCNVWLRGYDGNWDTERDTTTSRKYIPGTWYIYS